MRTIQSRIHQAKRFTCKLQTKAVFDASGIRNTQGVSPEKFQVILGVLEVLSAEPLAQWLNDDNEMQGEAISWHVLQELQVLYPPPIAVCPDSSMLHVNSSYCA